MSVLSTISKPVDRSAVITIAGEQGRAKTTLASLFPSPIFIRAEDGLQSIPVENRPDAFPILKTPDELWEQLSALIKEDHEYKTLVIDSVTALERIFIQSILEKESKEKKREVISISTALGGYGAGYSAISSMHQRVKKACNILNEKGMTIIFIAHADIEQLDLPDTEPYSRYSLRMNKKSLPPYVDDVDMVAFVKLEIFVVGDDDERRKKAVSDGTLVVDCVTAASSIAKNRYGIKDTFAFKEGVNPFINILPNVK